MELAAAGAGAVRIQSAERPHEQGHADPCFKATFPICFVALLLAGCISLVWIAVILVQALMGALMGS